MTPGQMGAQSPAQEDVAFTAREAELAAKKAALPTEEQAWDLRDVEIANKKQEMDLNTEIELAEKELYDLILSELSQTEGSNELVIAVTDSILKGDFDHIPENIKIMFEDDAPDNKINLAYAKVKGLKDDFEMFKKSLVK